MTADAMAGQSERLSELRRAIDDLAGDPARLRSWGQHLARILDDGGRLLAAGNGGSAAQGQHLCAELVGRFLSERRGLSAICLSSETSTLTAIANDYGAGEIFARQVDAHGRPGDVLVALSTSGHSPNVVAAVQAARACGMTAWAMTGAAPNALERVSDDALVVRARTTATVQEVHLVAIHLLCAAVDASVGAPLRLGERGHAPLAPVAEEVSSWAATS